ncbi:MAG: nickel pincer cofactor biosynthesis protein LarC [Phycisphaerae bacterium]
MTTAYFDCFAGAGGDMIVASLLDAGADFDALREHLRRLPVKGYDLRTERVHRRGLGGLRFVVDVEPQEQPHRHLHHITEMIDAAALPARAAERARKVFTRLAKAEAKVHRSTIEKVHFHEVGAVDSIVDIVGACVALELLGVERLCCGPVPLGSGTVQCDHGLMPVPAPATAELLVGCRTIPGANTGEMTTPTAAALFAALADTQGPPPAMELTATGWGAGTREGDTVPNLLRVLLGREGDAGQTDTVVELSTNVDDCTGEVLGATIEMLLGAGCVDAWATPAVMKRSRPAWVLSALCEPAAVAGVEELLFRQTTTFGIRRRQCTRSKLLREMTTVETPFGPVRVKVGRRDGQTLTASPEFADCLAAAETHHVPVREVLAAASQAWQESSE